MISARLVRNEHILKIFFETTPDILVIMGETGKILDCNHHFTKNLGYEKTEALGKIGPVEWYLQRIGKKQYLPLDR